MGEIRTRASGIVMMGSETQTDLNKREKKCGCFRESDSRIVRNRGR